MTLRKLRDRWVRALISTGLTALLIAAGVLGTPAPSSAEDPPLHNVRYTITSKKPYYADIYYRDVDPPNYADYSHDPYQFSPNVEADVGPGRPWVLDVALANPDEWAMVIATSGYHPDNPITPMFRCELAVDGVVVKTREGPSGVLCSIRNW